MPSIRAPSTTRRAGANTSLNRRRRRSRTRRKKKRKSVPSYLRFSPCSMDFFFESSGSFWWSNEFNGGQCEMKLRRLQQALFLPCTVENDKRQLQAQSQSRSTSKSDISSGAFLVVLQLTMDIMLSPRYRTFLSFT